MLLDPRWGHLYAVRVTVGRVSAKGKEYRCAGHTTEQRYSPVISATMKMMQITDAV